MMPGKQNSRHGACAARALTFFSKNILQHGFVERQISHQLLQSSIFFLKLL
jgi:hypothetical protein